MSFLQFLAAHETIHLITSAIIALLLWKIYSNKWVIFISLFAGLFLDVDHLFDYILDYLALVGPVFDLNKITAFFGDYMKASGKIYVPLHSLDFLWIWWFIGRYLNSTLKVRGLEWALILPITLHILVDHASYMPHPLAYFLFYRISHNFSRDSFNGL